MAQLMVVLDATVMNIALPTAQHALAFSDADRQWVVTGYQADVGHGLWGLLYEEALGRGALMNPSQACSAAAVVGGWNHYEIAANGCRIVVKLNGALCSTFGEGDASRPRDGYIALQYHAPGGFEVRFRNILIAELL